MTVNSILKATKNIGQKFQSLAVQGKKLLA